MEKTILELKDLTVDIEKHEIVSHASFKLHEGDVMAIIGPNGGGKTTLVKAILGLINYRGEIIHDKNLKIGYVPQRFTFDRSMPLLVSELFRLRLGINFVSKRKDDQIRDSLKSVGALKVFKSRLGVLSGGELQRVLIALALLNEPNLLILDEPSSGIDIGGEETIYNLIERLSKERNITIIFISHDMDVVYRYASEVICLNKVIMCEGPPKQALTEETLARTHGGLIQPFRHHR